MLYINETLPIKALKMYGSLFGDKRAVKGAELWNKASTKMHDMQIQFFPFINNTWIYESKRNELLWSLIKPEEQSEFNIDIRAIDWRECFYANTFGVRRFFFKEDTPAPEMKFRQLLKKNRVGWFHDVLTANETTRFLTFKDNAVYFPAVMSAQKFKDFLSLKVNTKHF